MEARQFSWAQLTSHSVIQASFVFFEFILSPPMGMHYKIYCDVI